MVAFRLDLSVTLLFAVLVCCGTSIVSAAESQSDSKVQSSKTKPVEPSRYSFRKEHDRNGIGKFYMGREIARVMGFGGVDWLERPQRQTEENLTLLVKSLKLKPGMVVADIGAGSGVISVLMADQIGTEGKVMAVDVQKEMLDRLKAKVKRLGIENIIPVKGTQKTTGLKEKSVDLVILVDVYHEFAFPYEMMLEISKILKPGGRVAFVEYRKEDPTVPIKLVHKMTEAQVKKEITQPEFGLKWKETIGVLPRQHIVVFERVSDF
ncbi:MAG: class I SAM-dependent methyltransferase [Planctomycetes bacterium]|nr:class I SAM-dependent methyltransferase [Planctomycetota bacterium]